MTKLEIAQRVLNDSRDESERAHIPETSDVDYEPIIFSALEKSLQTVRPDTDIRTCEDFAVSMLRTANPVMASTGTTRCRWSRSSPQVTLGFAVPSIELSVRQSRRTCPSFLST
jgi:hypothetical protein